MNQLKIITVLAIFVIICQSTNAQLTPFSDSFNSPCTFDDWNFVNDTEGWNASQFEEIDISTSHPGQLMMMPYTCAWFNNRRGPLMYQLVDGDFTFTTRVTATNRAQSDMPGAEYSLAGAMIRTPKTLTTGPVDWANSEEENYIFLSTGFASMGHPSCFNCPGPHFEVKSTTNGNSNLAISSVASGPIIIRIIRRGIYFLVLVQEEGQNMRVHRRYTRADMPDTLQVGVLAYTDWDKVNTYSVPNHNQYVLNANLDPSLSNNPLQPFNPGILARFDYARYGSTTWPDSLNNVNLANENIVPDHVILSIAGLSEAPEFIGHIWQGIVDGDVTNPLNWFPNSVPDITDDVMIPNCNCPQVALPQLFAGTWNIKSLELAPGAFIEVAEGAILNVVE